MYLIVLSISLEQSLFQTKKANQKKKHEKTMASERLLEKKKSGGTCWFGVIF
jgi:hypothetical protein